MFIGHLALGLAAKPLAPRSSLGTLMLSTVFLDALWPVFLLLGWERVRVDPGNTAFTPLDFESYPLSHSLVTSLGWALLFGGVHFLRTRYRRGAILLGLGVASHWALDLVTHRPDLPITPAEGSPKLGWGLWNSVPGTLAVELVLFGAGIWVYLRATRPRDRIGTWGFTGFMALLLAIYLGNAFGPPPPGPQAIAWAMLASLPLFLIPAWVDRHRRAVP